MNTRTRIATACVSAVGALTAGLALISPAPASAAAPTAAVATPVAPVASVDLSRYIGKWYQVAAIPQIFEVQCSGNAMAEYKANPDGTIGVNNTCKTWWGSTSQVLGIARVENIPANSVLTVSFLNLFGTPIYFGGPNYEVVGLDTNYQWAVVTDPNRSSAFVLSRTPALTDAQATTVKRILTGNGVDTCRLETTPQTGGAPKAVKFC